jgi:adenine-specific DNA-methyltransferase
MSTAVINKIEAILHSAYDTKNFMDFVNEVLPDVHFVAPDRFRKEYSNFSSHIDGSIHIGNYRTPDSKNIVILAVQLNKSRYVENSRSTQRSYAKKLIENGNADAALIAFYTDGDPKWRLSFVRLDYEMKFDNGKLQTAENLTPAKRYSYLVGENEPCHTAIKQFNRFITDSIANPEHPTLDDLEDAFSVERVTDEFFALYCEKFHQLREELEANEDFRIEAEQHNFTSAQFAKKLMGQIVFLYFLQKKGWLGVSAWPNSLNEKEYKNAYYSRGSKSRELIPKVYLPAGEGTYRISGSALNSISDDDEAVLASCVKGKPWGTGPHNFMRKLFNWSESRHMNFFDDVLEPLFYDALNVNRGEQGYCPALHCRIPFLSGGLFEPIDGYDWKHNDFALSNSIFSNAEVKGRDADGILDIFDRYNFTMSEDEPLEREVAIDPEMLGKVFENLLEVNDRKSKGAFYTPREIVHYMCQESLISYLTTVMKIDEADIRDFILYGDFMKDEDTVKEKREGNGAMFISEQLYRIDNNGKVVVDRLSEMDKALQNVRIADPAVGSGAFPLGMLNEIVRARQNISAYMAITMKPYDIRMMYQLERSPHTLKYETIRNCIFAADLEPSAVDIAQLRLWLSLVIDDEINPDAQTLLDGHRNPLPLPNLECNILCGNSLIDSFEGSPLINESDLIGNVTKNSQINLNQAGFETVLRELIEKQNDLFRCDNTEKKQQIKDEIESLRDMIILSQLQGSDSEKIRRYEESKRSASHPYVLWQLDFARVFREKGGFDIVIGNPPYIQLQRTINEDTGEKLGDLYVDCGFETFAKTGDIYCLFYEKGFKLLHPHGVLTFITSNKWMRAGYGEKLRAFFANNTNPIRLIDFGSQKIFESATVDVNVLSFTKDKNQGRTLACTVKEDCTSNLSVYIEQHNSTSEFVTAESWVILLPVEYSIRSKMRAQGTPLSEWNLSINYGIKTGFNDAFIVTTEKKDELIAADPKSAEIIRPILRGRDIKRYTYSFADLWLIATFPSRHYNIDDFPAVKNHLLSFGLERLEQTGRKHIVDGVEVKARKKTNNKWFETQDSISYWNEFFKQKIVYREISDAMDACLVESGYMLNNKCYLITGEHLIYILSYLNSKLFTKIVLPQANITGGKGEGFLSEISLIPPSPEVEKEFARLYDLRQHGSSVDDRIDSLFCSLYGLAEDETRYILE